MSEIITISHAEFTARQTTYDALRNANCHMTWVPEFVDLALSRFPAYTLSRLVESPTFVQGCAEIIASEYKDPEAKRRQVFVTPETLGNAGRTAHLEFMDAYTSRALQRCLKHANLSIIDNEKWEDGQSIIFVQYTVIMPNFLVGKTDGSTATAYHCASYCGRSMRSAIEPLKDLIFDGQRKDYVPDVRLQINDDGTVFDPTEGDMVTNYQTTIRQISHHVTDVELRNAIDAALSRSRYPTLIDGLLTGAMENIEAAEAAKRSLSWVDTCLMNPFIADVQTQLMQFRVNARPPRKTNIRTLRDEYSKCFPANPAGGSITM